LRRKTGTRSKPGLARHPFAAAVELFLLHSLVVAAAVLWGGTLLPENLQGRFFLTYTDPFARGLANWDAGWYLKIAAHGYDARSIVFFPLFPLLIRSLSLLGLPGPAAGLIIANLSFLAALWLLMLLARTDGWRFPAAYRAALSLALFPTGVFFSAVYTESLFLALVLAAFLCARRRHWGAACLLAALSALTRNPGLVLLPALGWEYLAQKKEGSESLDRQALYLFLVPLLFAAFPLYQKFFFGDALAFVHHDSLTVWGRLATWPVRPVILTFKDLVPPHFVYWWTSLLDDLLFAILAAVLLVLGSGRLRTSYLVYAGLSLLMPLSSYVRDEPLASLPRYVIVLFPVYLVLARCRRRVRLFLLVLFSALLLLFTVLYVNGFWVA